MSEIKISPRSVLVSLLLVFVGVIHLLPTMGVLGPEHLEKLYGLQTNEPDLELLLRHRSLLFGLLGVFLVAASFRPTLRPAAITAGLVSVGSFLWLAFLVGGLGPELSRVVAADWVALASLLLALGLDRGKA